MFRCFIASLLLSARNAIETNVSLPLTAPRAKEINSSPQPKNLGVFLQCYSLSRTCFYTSLYCLLLFTARIQEHILIAPQSSAPVLAEAIDSVTASTESPAHSSRTVIRSQSQIYIRTCGKNILFAVIAPHKTRTLLHSNQHHPRIVSFLENPDTTCRIYARKQL